MADYSTDVATWLVTSLSNFILLQFDFTAKINFKAAEYEEHSLFPYAELIPMFLHPTKITDFIHF